MRRALLYLIATPLLLVSSFALAQVCNCPPPSACSPCSGGYTSLTLRYEGAVAALVLIKDVDNVRADLLLAPGQELTFTGSKKNEKFADKNISVLVNGLANALLGSSCKDLTVGATYGAFTVVSAVSVGGTLVCCAMQPVDLIPPSFSNVPASFTIAATTKCSATPSWIEPETSDNCQLASVTSTHKPGDTFPIGATEVIYTATDAAGLRTTTSFTVTVTDTSPPKFTNVQAQILATASGNSCSAPVTWSEPQITDECSFTISRSHKPGDSFPVGTTAVTYSAMDAAGNKSIQRFNVIVANSSPLTFVNGQADDIVVDVAEACAAKVSWIEPKVVYPCTFNLIRSHKPGDIFQLGKTRVEYTAIDAAGRKSTRSFNVTVVDVAAPVFSGGPVNDIVVTSEQSCSATVFWTEPVISDFCTVTLEQSHKPGDSFSAGKTKVHYSAIDASGNKSEFYFHIVVEDARALTFKNCPTTAMVVTSEERSPAKISWPEITLTDNCEEITLVTNHEQGTYFPPGHTSVEYVASTPSGKTAYCTFAVTLLVKEKALEIATLITPDGDGFNDDWRIGNIENFKANKVVIVDRWGGKIFEASGYNNESIVWRGTNQTGSVAPTGTYFYTVIASSEDKRIHERGAIELIH